MCAGGSEPYSHLISFAYTKYRDAQYLQSRTHPESIHSLLGLPDKKRGLRSLEGVVLGHALSR